MKPKILTDIEKNASDISKVANDLQTSMTDYATLEQRVETIITTPAEGVSVQEIIDARDGKVSLGEKIRNINVQLVDTSSQLAAKEAIKKILPVTPKAIYNQGGVVMVISRKPHGKGFVRFKLRDNQFTTNVSVGAPAQLLRVVEVYEVDECFSFKHKEALVDDVVNWQTLNVNYVKVGIGQQTLPVRSTITKAAGRWIEYSVNLPKGMNEVVALINKTAGSSTDVTVSVDGSPVLTGQNFNGSGFERLVIPVGRSGQHIIRFTTNIAQHLNIAGVNVVDIKDYVDGYEYDTLLALVKTASNEYVISNGAMEYALLDADTNLWCGSYHGGETRNRLQYILDGQPITLNDGDVRIGRVFEIEQDTNIVSKINAYSTQRFEGDGSIEHETIFNGSINLKTLFTNMTTAKDTFEEIVYPIRNSMVGQDRVYLPAGIDYVVQRNASTMQKVTTILNNKKYPSNASILPYIKKTVGAYNKVYNANIQSETGINFTGGHFKTMHIFE